MRFSTAVGDAPCSEIVSDGTRRGLRLAFEDQGPGIADIQVAMKDGYYHRRRPGARPVRREAAVQRICD